MPCPSGEIVHFPEPRGALHPPPRNVSISPASWLVALSLALLGAWLVSGCAAEPRPSLPTVDLDALAARVEAQSKKPSPLADGFLLVAREGSHWCVPVDSLGVRRVTR